jgi:hypothetical protein
MSEPVDLKVIAAPDGFDIVRADDGAPVLSQYAAEGARPYLHPIHAPNGAGVLTENAPDHHPWQHGLYVGLNDVNGVGFWSEGLHPKRPTGDGTFSSRVAQSPEVSGGRVTWVVETDYLDEGGEVLLDDSQRWTLAATSERLELDMDWTLHARPDLVFGEYEYGGLFLRMPYRRDVGGSAIDSEGQSASGERARWVAVTLPLPDTGREVTAALLEHPDNPDFPVLWRIDNELGIGPSPSAAGPWELPADTRRRYRYRLVVFGEAVDAAAAEDAWHRFAEEA